MRNRLRQWRRDRFVDRCGDDLVSWSRRNGVSPRAFKELVDIVMSEPWAKR